ncbi:hypothetical protein PPMP20_17875 [Paraburkholderia phymatum]|uniref:Transmembrane protein n=1 Tax=Paraburkholderia phymatum (strain DSM 17167 / CIP 108236 / LMG 21445 / STM815) TaxID=391038 RepID=B2JTN5_PARP8|nr:hypothetical protein [Paraburkholderia phymatum]ACC75938.1 hypothetical protein Bphy_6928 [Paraburkholderia phymatum STM815]
MFDIIFGAAHAIYIAGALVGSVVLWPDQTYPLHKAPEERETVTVVGFHPQWYKADSKCHYSGLIVPYVRDWPETINAGRSDERVLPPDLDRTAGHAVILDTKTCPGKEDEKVLLVDAVERNFGALGGGTDFHFDDPDTIKPEYKPKWLPQVMERLQRVAEHNDNAKEMVTAITQLEQKRAEQVQATAKAMDAGPASAPTLAIGVAAASAPAASATQSTTATASSR